MNLRSAFLAAAVATTMLLTACMSAPMAPPPPTMSAGGVLTGTNQMTLYTFDKDTADSGKSVCNGMCAKNWPPLMADAGATAAGAYSIITRDDGGRQWAFKGKPLYFWVKDAKPGDMSGDGFNNLWRVAKP